MAEGYGHDVLSDYDGDSGSLEREMSAEEAATTSAPLAMFIDTSGDGATDVIAVDDTGDGHADFTLVDDTGDGFFDTVVVPGATLAIDTSGLLVEYDSGTQVPMDDAPTGEPLGEEPTVVGDVLVDPELPGLPGTASVGPINGIPTQTATEGDLPSEITTTDTVVGDPAGDADDWFLQAANGFCVPAALAQVVTEFTGEPVTDLGVAAVAEQLGHFEAAGGGDDGFSGMTSQGALATLEAMGVPAHIEYAPETDPFSALAAHIDAGRDVVIALDSQELWYSADDDAADGASDDNHVVVVTGVDTEAGVAYLNDPGDPAGRAVEVPLDELAEAWEDASYEMLVTDAPSPEVDTGVEADMIDVGSDLDLADDEVAVRPSSAGVVYLPLMMDRARF